MDDRSLDFEYLLHNIKGTDPRLRVALVETWYRHIHQLAHFLIDDPDQADYAVIETFNNAWAQLDRFPSGTRFLPWLTKIHVKAIRKYVNSNTEDRHPGLRQPDLKAQIRETYKALPLKLRLPVVLSILQGLSVPQISDSLGARENSIELQLEDGFARVFSQDDDPLPLPQGDPHKATRRALLNGDAQTADAIDAARDHLTQCEDCLAFRDRVTAEKGRMQTLFSEERAEDGEEISMLLEFLALNDTSQTKRRRIAKLGKEIAWVGVAIAVFLGLGVLFGELSPWLIERSAIEQARQAQALVPVEEPAQFTVAIAESNLDSNTSAGPAGLEGSWNPEISNDGNWIVFSSAIKHLVDDDTNNTQDIFVMSLVDGAIERVSEGTGSLQANNASFDASISGDGRFIVFNSWADNLDRWDEPRCRLWGITESCPDIFFHDRQTGATRLISRNRAGISGDSFSIAPKISANGEKVVYWSAASDLALGDSKDCGIAQETGPDPISCLDIFVYNSRYRSTTRIPIGRQIDSNFSTTNVLLDISGDGRWLLTSVRATDQIAKELHITSSPSLYVFDLESLEASPVNVAPDGTPGNGPSFDGGISSDGRYVAFSSQASNLVEGDTNRAADVFVLDRQSGDIARISEREDGSQVSGDSGVINPGRYFLGVGLDISADGEWVIYSSASKNLTPDIKFNCQNTDSCQYVYLTNRRTGESFQLNSTNIDFLPFTSLSEAGIYAVFMSHSPVCEPGEFCNDIYLYNMLLDETFQLGGFGTAPDLKSLKPTISGESYVYSMHSNRVTAVAFSPDGRVLASGSRDGLVRLFSTDTNDTLATLEGNGRGVTALAFSPDGELLAAAYEGDEMYLWGLPENTLTGVLPGFPNVRGLSFSADGEILAMGGTRAVWLWAVNDGFLDDALDLPDTHVSAVQYSPDGRYLAAAGDDNTVWVWQMPSRELALRLGGHEEKVNSIAFSPDLSLLASASNDGTAQVWEIDFSDPENLSPRHLYTFDHGDWISSIAFSSDSRRLVSGSFDSSIAVWDLEDPQLLGTLFNQRQNQVLSIAIATDGDQLAAGTVQGEVHYWDRLLDNEEFR